MSITSRNLRSADGSNAGFTWLWYWLSSIHVCFFLSFFQETLRVIFNNMRWMWRSKLIGVLMNVPLSSPLMLGLKLLFYSLPIHREKRKTQARILASIQGEHNSPVTVTPLGPNTFLVETGLNYMIWNQMPSPTFRVWASLATFWLQNIFPRCVESDQRKCLGRWPCKSMMVLFKGIHTLFVMLLGCQPHSCGSKARGKRPWERWGTMIPPFYTSTQSIIYNGPGGSRVGMREEAHKKIAHHCPRCVCSAWRPFRTWRILNCLLHWQYDVFPSPITHTAALHIRYNSMTIIHGVPFLFCLDYFYLHASTCHGCRKKVLSGCIPYGWKTTTFTSIFQPSFSILSWLHTRSSV